MHFSRNLSLHFTLLLVSFCFIKCKQENTQTVVSIKPNKTFKQSDNVRKIQLSTFSDSVSYLILQQDDNNIIGKITKLLVLENRFVVADLSLSKAVFIFDAKGKLIRKITRSSNTSEPSTIEDVAIDVKSNKLYVYCAAQSKIYTYNDNGEIIKSTPMPNGYFSFFDKIDGGFLFYRELQKAKSDDFADNARLCYIDSLGNYKKGFYKYVRSKDFQLPNSNVFFNRDKEGDLIFCSLDSTSVDVVYQFENKSLKITPAIEFDFGTRKEMFAHRYFSLRSIDEYLNFISNSSLNLGLPVITDNWMVGQYSTNKLIYTYLYNAKSKVTLSGAGFENDIDGIPINSTDYMHASGNLLYTTVDIEFLQFEHEALIKNKIKDPFLKSTKQSILNRSYERPETIVVAKIHQKE